MIQFAVCNIFTSAEIRRWIGITSGTRDNLQKIWNSPNINLTVKKKVLQRCVFSTFLYASETWTLKKVDINKINPFELKCYQRLLNVNGSTVSETKLFCKETTLILVFFTRGKRGNSPCLATYAELITTD